MKAKLKDLDGWPPNRARIKPESPGPTPSPGDYAKAILVRVCPLIPDDNAITLAVKRDEAKGEELVDLFVSDPKIQRSLFKLLSNHKGRTIETIGEIDVTF